MRLIYATLKIEVLSKLGKADKRILKRALDVYVDSTEGIDSKKDIKRAKAILEQIT